MAVDHDGLIWTYNASAAAWTPRTLAGIQPWSAATMSANGQIIAVGTGPGAVYLSEDGGATWYQDTSGGLQYWTGG